MITNTPAIIRTHARIIMTDNALIRGDAQTSREEIINAMPFISISHQPLIFAPPSQNDAQVRVMPVVKSHRAIIQGMKKAVIPG